MGTHTMSKGQMHRKYTQQSIKTNVSRKPPIRHKWSMSTQFDQLLEPPSTQMINSPISDLYDQNEAVCMNLPTEKKGKKIKKASKKKKKSVKNGLKAPSEVQCVWSKQPSPSFTGSFMELQAEDTQQQKLQIKRKQIQHIKRRHDEIKIATKQKHEVIKPKLIKSSNPWQSNGAKPINLAKQKMSKIISKKQSNVNKHQHTNHNQKKNKKQQQSTVNSSWSSRAKPSKQQSSKSSSVGSKKGSNKQDKVRRNREKHNKQSKVSEQQQNNKNIEAVNKVSPELQQWLRTEIKKLNPDVEA